MQPPAFVDIPYRARRHMVELELETALARLTKGAPTAYVNHVIAQALGRGDKETYGLVLEIARTHEQARPDGPIKKRYGKDMRGYVWYPRAKSAREVIDDSDW